VNVPVQAYLRYRLARAGLTVRAGGIGRPGSLGVWCTDIGVVIGGGIVGEVPEFNALVVGPKEVENQSQSDE